jgi:uncharacterized protein YerC
MKGRRRIIDKWRPAQRAALMEALQRGAKLAHISEEFGLSVATIKRIRQSTGVLGTR